MSARMVCIYLEGTIPGTSKLAPMSGDMTERYLNPFQKSLLGLVIRC